MADTLPRVTVPTLLVHATGDTEIRLRQAHEMAEACGAEDRTYAEVAGAPHYLEGRRGEAMDLLIDWLRDRVPGPVAAGPVTLLTTDVVDQEGGPRRRTILGGAVAIGVLAGVGLAAATGALIWPVIGAVAGVGVGDLVAGGRR